MKFVSYLWLSELKLSPKIYYCEIEDCLTTTLLNTTDPYSKGPKLLSPPRTLMVSTSNIHFKFNNNISLYLFPDKDNHFKQEESCVEIDGLVCELLPTVTHTCCILEKECSFQPVSACQ